MNLPQARTDLIIQKLGDETMIYDLIANKSYCLNSTAGVVFNACDGIKTLADLEGESNFSADIIFLSLDQINRNNLLETEYISPFAGMNRRDVIKKVGLASMIALPVISSLIAPEAAQASSVCTRSAPCVCAQGTSLGMTCGQGINFTSSSSVSYIPCNTGCTCRSAGCGTEACGGRCE